ncbi:MAG: amino acid adenylation domain-containing protein, partial [Planctomycetota bacterium]|nr:amino acid adenylation domain-containing protein [Planctomycetota bacterium]
MTRAPAPRLLHEVFARSARLHPERIAVDVPPSPRRSERVTRTYAQIDRDALRAAACLGPDRGERVVAVLLGRHDPWLYACQLGIQRAGAAWVGLDARHPDTALRFVLEDAAVTAAFADAEGAARLRALGVDGLTVHDVEDLPEPDAVPDFAGEADRLAYVIYTSGTTGRPKGVLVEHRSAVNLVLGDVDEFGLGPEDRVAQGSSPAYDSSVEEVWLAWAVGGAVVPLDDDVVRSGPDLLPWLRDERITALCPPPTLLRTLGARDPERDLPDLRLLYVGGEALDQDLADRWSRGRRMVNGYGPTECTVTVTRADVTPGCAVTIGTAVPGSRALVLDDGLSPVPEGEDGELCIAGQSLARGYLGRPELTAERFVEHPLHGRIYRTGDLVRMDANGQLMFGGRRDTQVKLRGHRVELGEIEVRLIGRRGVTAAACVVDAGGTLRAFVVGAAAGSDQEALRGDLAAELPSHMVPVSIERIDALPTTVGGKLDRRALAARFDVRVDEPDRPDAVLDGVVGVVHRAFAAALGCRSGLGLDEDFFEAGGDSVRAATLVSALRDDADTAGLTVRDVYEARTVRGLAARAGTSARAAPAPGSQQPAADTDWRVLVVAAQTVWVLVEGAAAVAVAWLTFFTVLPAWLAFAGDLTGILLLPVLAALARALWWPIALSLTVAVKRTLIGRYSAGSWPVRGWMHFRHWVVVRVARTIPHGLVQGTELQSVTLRALGARVGRDVHLTRGVDVANGGWDLLSLGDGAVVERDGALELCVLDDGQLVIGAVTVGEGAVIGVRGGVGPGGSVGAGAEVTALSRVGAGQAVPAGERFGGVPAGREGVVKGRVDPAPTGLGPWSHASATVAMRLAGGVVGPIAGLSGLLAVAAVLGISAGDVAAFLADPALTVDLGLGLSACLAVVVPVVLSLQALALRSGPKCPAGVHPLRSFRQILADERMRSVEAAGIWLSGTLFWPVWLRAAGARVGISSEVSTIMDVLPEHLSIGGRSFFADGIYLGGPSRGRGCFEVRPVSVDPDTFFGNHVVVPCGARLPERILVGVCAIADPTAIRAGTSWFGHPIFELPRREVVTVDERLTFRPGPLRYGNRVFWELLRFLIPGAGAVFALGWLDGAARGTVGGIAVTS